MVMNADWTAPHAMELLEETAAAVITALDVVDDWGPSGLRETQYKSDVAADTAALGVLERAAVGVLSEESGLRRASSSLLVVVDPLDGSTNAERGLPWYATSLCAVDARGPLAALVVNLASGERFSALRGGGAWRNGESISSSTCTSLAQAFVGLSGLPPRHLGWRQFRAYGASALDLCAVACGVLDAFIDCSPSAHGVWDYLGGLLICEEAGAVVTDAHRRDLLVRDPSLRRTPVAAAGADLLDEILAVRRTFA
jgi:myo-inositol-1(or 4)-monophosphatase